MHTQPVPAGQSSVYSFFSFILSFVFFWYCNR